jgi:hypothetical protein
MIDPATSWFNKKQVQNREAHTVTSVVEHGSRNTRGQQ